MKIGDIVKFEDKVFAPPYVPYYDAYKDHVFQIISFWIYNDDADDLIPINEYYNTCHIKIKCISNSNIKVGGLIHDDEIYVIYEV